MNAAGTQGHSRAGRLGSGESSGSMKPALPNGLVWGGGQEHRLRGPHTACTQHRRQAGPHGGCAALMRPVWVPSAPRADGAHGVLGKKVSFRVDCDGGVSFANSRNRPDHSRCKRVKEVGRNGANGVQPHRAGRSRTKVPPSMRVSGVFMELPKIRRREPWA